MIQKILLLLSSDFENMKFSLSFLMKLHRNYQYNHFTLITQRYLKNLKTFLLKMRTLLLISRICRKMWEVEMVFSYHRKILYGKILPYFSFSLVRCELFSGRNLLGRYNICKDLLWRFHIPEFFTEGIIEEHPATCIGSIGPAKSCSIFKCISCPDIAIFYFYT